MRQSHEWHEQDEDAGERRFFRARKFGNSWEIKTTLKSEEDWHYPKPVPLPLLEALRAQLENKYARRRVPWEHLQSVDKLVAAAGGEAKYADNKAS